MSKKTIIKICSAILGLSGLVIIGSTLYPIVSYEWNSGKKYPILVSPRVDNFKSVTSSETAKDFTKASNWFDTEKSESGFVSDNISFYTLTIPKLGIHDATVSIGGEDLSQNLVQYSGSVIPGKIGNSVIFGHSILPQFFNPENYLSIFSTLPDLSEEDQIFVNYDGITYEYQVEDMFEVRPTDIQILEQDKSDSFLTLVTCTPPGDPRKPKRLIVRARINRHLQADGNFSN